MKKCLCVLLALALLAGLGLTVGRTPIYNLYREIEYRRSTPTEAEQTVHAYAAAHKIPYGSYPKDLIELLEINPETRDFVLNYPTRLEIPVDLSGYSRETVPLFLQWDPMWGYEKYGSGCIGQTGCGPTCLAMVGYYLTGKESFNPKDVAAFSGKNGYYASGYGSSWTLISEGGVKLGLKVQELPLVKGKMTAAVEAERDMDLIDLGIAKLQAENSTDYGLIMAGAALAAVPIIIVFLAFQKYFTKGITMGAVKG